MYHGSKFLFVLKFIKKNSNIFCRGKCNSYDRGHEYALYLQNIEKENWRKNRRTRPENDYSNYHKNKKPSTWGKKDHLLLERYGSWVLESSITKSTCTPILLIKFLGNLQNYRKENFERLSKTCVCDETCDSTQEITEKLIAKQKEEQNRNQGSESVSEMSLENGFMIIVGSVIGGVVFLVVAAILFVKWQKARKFRGP